MKPTEEYLRAAGRVTASLQLDAPRRSTLRACLVRSLLPILLKTSLPDSP